MKALLLVFVLLLEIVCGDPISDAERQASDAAAFNEHIKRMLDGFDRMVESKTFKTSFHFLKDGAEGFSGASPTKSTKICEDLGGHSMVLTSKRRVDIINAYRKEWSTLGSKRNSKTENLTWLTGEDIEPSNFAWTESNDGVCLIYHKPNKMWRFDCGWTTATAACELDRWVFPMSKFTSVNIKTTFFAVPDTSISYQQAESQCGKLSARLATPSSFKELGVVDELLERISAGDRKDGGYWLGARRAHFGHNPEWSTGYKIAGNLREFHQENGGLCLVYDSEKRFDWRNCQLKGNDSIGGFICQIDN